MNSARGYQGAAGTQTAALVSGLELFYLNTVENYDGSSWTEITDVNGARYEASGFGTTTAAIAAGGLVLTPTEKQIK